ncbi:MAG: hypothetical protein OSJ62_01010 [Lachnospiraceae bacterium]|nr:hypothetical protein [Lachnospiraceae bacterium]
MDDRILFLSRLEFAILLLTENITEILCFPLPNVQEIEEKQMIEAAYELVCMGCIQVNETCIRQTESIERLTREIKNAKQYLLIEPGNLSYPQKIAYIGERIVVLEYVQEEGKVFRLFSMERQEFFQWLEDSMEVPTAVFEKKEEAESITAYSELAVRERNVLSACDPRDCQSLSEWIERAEEILQETVYFGLACISRQEPDKKLECLLCQGTMNLWLLWYQSVGDFCGRKFDQESLQTAPDSAELRKEIREMLWREEK